MAIFGEGEGFTRRRCRCEKSDKVSRKGAKLNAKAQKILFFTAQPHRRRVNNCLHLYLPQADNVAGLKANTKS
jgi:hypothetical protein